MTNTAIVLEIACVLVLVGFTAYVGGRVHQWRMQDDERNTAFREGFLRASSALESSAPSKSRSPHETGMKRTRIFYDPR